MSRSVWKGPFSSFASKALLSFKVSRTGKKDSKQASQIFDLKKQLTKENTLNIPISSTIRVWSRNSMILPEYVGKRVEIYNGKSWSRRSIVEDMVGHKFGEFSYTKKKTIHKLNKTKSLARRI